MTKAGRIVLYSACGQRTSSSSGLFIYYLQDGEKFTFNEYEYCALKHLQSRKAAEINQQVKGNENHTY